MRLVVAGIRGLWYYFWAHIFLFLCMKKYLNGRWFEGSNRSVFCGICTIGWEWTVRDALDRIHYHENRTAKYPISHNCRVVCPENIEFDSNDLNNFQGFGNYYQAVGKIQIGRETYIAPDVGLITANHDILDPDRHIPPENISIGEKCWIGMNSVILPGVILGDHTVVGAGSVVTKSFPEGYCVIAGNPAKVIKEINWERFEEGG